MSLRPCEAGTYFCDFCAPLACQSKRNAWLGDNRKFCVFSGSSEEIPQVASTQSAIPAWLKNELQEAEFIPRLDLGDSDNDDTEKPSKEHGKTKDNDNSTPNWLQAELDESDATAKQNDSHPDTKSEDFTEDGDLGISPRKVSGETEKKSEDGEEEEDTDLQSYLGKSLSKADCVKLIADLQQKVEKLEAENQMLHKTVAQQLNRITDLENKANSAGMNQTI